MTQILHLLLNKAIHPFWTEPKAAIFENGLLARHPLCKSVLSIFELFPECSGDEVLNVLDVVRPWIFIFLKIAILNKHFCYLLIMDIVILGSK